MGHNVEFKNKLDMKEKWTITVRNPLFWLYVVVRSFIRKERCTHEEWDMDNQIRIIKCRSCGKKAWVREYKNLYQSVFKLRTTTKYN